MNQNALHRFAVQCSHSQQRVAACAYTVRIALITTMVLYAKFQVLLLSVRRVHVKIKRCNGSENANQLQWQQYAFLIRSLITRARRFRPSCFHGHHHGTSEVIIIHFSPSRCQPKDSVVICIYFPRADVFLIFSHELNQFTLPKCIVWNK